jgi:phosphonate transport system substrate-binding protein
LLANISWNDNLRDVINQDKSVKLYLLRIVNFLTVKTMRLIYFLAILIWFAFSTLPASASDPKLEFGFLPYFSPAKLMELHSPLKQYLEENLNSRIIIISAPNFKEFQFRTKEKRYDIIFTAPHMARLAEFESGYQRVVMSRHRGRPIFLIRQDSSISKLQNLTGKKISLPPPRAIIHHVAVKALKRSGLQIGKTVTIVVTPSHSSALLSLLNHQVSVAVMGNAPWRTYQKKYKNQVKVLDASADFPGFLIMAHPKMPLKMVNQIKNVFLDFSITNAGRKYLEATGLEDLVHINDETMAELDPYVEAIFGIEVP